MTLLLSYWTLFSFSIAVLSAPVWPILPDWKWSIISITCLLLSIKYRGLRTLLGISLAIFIVLIKGHQLQQQQNMIFRTAADITISARIDSLFKQIRHGYEGTVLLKSINGETLPFFYQPKIRLVSPTPFNIGETINVTIAVNPIYGRMNEVGFDSESYYFSQGWVARASVMKQRSMVRYSRGSFRQTLYHRVIKHIEHSDVKGPIIALVFGERSLITDHQWQSYRDSGLIHLIAISGLHIGAVFFVGFWAGKLISRCSSKLLWAPWILGSVLALMYSWLAGFTLPTQRALVMCLLASLFTMANITLPLPKKLLITLAIVLGISPFSGVSNSFWLSFYAVTMVLYIVSQPVIFKSSLLRAIRAQVWIVLWMTPVTAVLFGGFSATSLLYNVVFVPWFTIVVIPSILLSLVTTLLNMDVASWCWRTVELLLEPVNWSTDKASVSWIVVSQHQTRLLVTACVFLFVAQYLNRQAQKHLVLLMSIICAYEWVRPLDSLSWKIDVLDVGHGLATVIEKNGRVLVYDTGSRWENGSIAESLIIPLLNRRGIAHLDGLILSHLDSDHAGGRAILEKSLSPKLKLTPQIIDGYEACMRGEVHHWQGLRLEIVWPTTQVIRAYNPHSCVIRIVDDNVNFSLLMTGDIDALVEWLLIRHPTELKSDIMIVPHHGSATSSTANFIQAVNPNLAIASLAKGGRWTLPDKKVVSRYAAQKSDWLDTGQYGQITIQVRQNMWQVSTIREREGPRWYRQMLRNGVE